MSKTTAKYIELDNKVKAATKELNDLTQVMNGLNADTGLLIASSVPGLGTPADIASLGLSLSRGDWGGAMWDLVGFVPFVGDAGKAIGKGAKISKQIARVNRAMKKFQDVIDAGTKKLAKLCKGKPSKKKVNDAACNSSTGNCSGKNAKGVNGGAHRQTTKPVGDGKDSHHMPDRNADPNVHPNDGPAIKMDPKDHAKTSSNGRNGLEGKKYRAETAEMIKDEKYRDAMAREIKDVRRSAQEVSGDRTKYNTNIQEMLDYAKESGQLPPK